MGLSSLQAFHGRWPDVELYYALPAWIVPLYKHYQHPKIRVVPLKLEGLLDTAETYLDLRSYNFDAIYELHQAGRSRRLLKGLSALERIPYGYHNHHLKSGGPVHDQGKIKPLIQRDLDGVFSFFRSNDGIPHYLDHPPSFLLAGTQPVKRDRLILGVVATRETKMLPFSLYARAVELILQGHPTMEIAIPLAPNDFKTHQRLIREAPALEKYVVHWSLERLPGEFAQSRFYMGNDTGLKHLAVSLNLSTLTFFGPEPPHEWHPYETEQHRYFYVEPLECRTREAHFCGLSQCDSMICLNQFRPEDMAQVVLAWI